MRCFSAVRQMSCLRVGHGVDSIGTSGNFNSEGFPKAKGGAGSDFK